MSWVTNLRVALWVLITSKAIVTDRPHFSVIFSAFFLFFFRQVWSLTVESSPDNPKSSGSHKGDGFLKSVWHTFTNNPTRQKAAESGSSSSVNESDKEEGKKQSGSGSG